MRENGHPPLEKVLEHLIDPEQRKAARLAILHEELEKMSDATVTQEDVGQIVTMIEGEYTNTGLMLASIDTEIGKAVIYPYPNSSPVEIPITKLVKFSAFHLAFVRALERYPFLPSEVKR